MFEEGFFHRNGDGGYCNWAFQGTSLIILYMFVYGELEDQSKQIYLASVGTFLTGAKTLERLVEKTIWLTKVRIS